MASAEDVVEALDAAGVDRAICFTWPFADPGLCAEANDYLAAAVRRHPDRLVGFGCVQPADPGAAAEVERCARLGLRGLGELNADAQGWALEDEAALGPVAAAAAAAGLVWTLHCSEPVGHLYPGKGTATPDRVAALAARHPEVTIVAAHLGGGLPLHAHMPEVAELCRGEPPLRHRRRPLPLPALGVRGGRRGGRGRPPPLRQRPPPPPRPPLPRDHSRARARRRGEAAILGGNAVRLLGL